MHKFTPLLFISIMLFGCTTFEKKHTQETSSDIFSNPTEALTDTTPRVTGIGGIFFASDNPAEMRQWYADHLGLALNDWGSAFEFRNANRPDEINYLQWGLFKTGSSYFEPSVREFMINYRVQNIEALVRKLQAEGVVILDTIAEYEYGKFVHILDHDGNKVELWEPVDSVLTQIGGKTTK